MMIDFSQRLPNRNIKLRNGSEGVIKWVLLYSKSDDKMPLYKVNLVTSAGVNYTTFYYQNGCCYNPNTSDLDILFVVPNPLKRKEGE